MRIEQEARDLARWLQTRPDGFPPLRIIRVDASSRIDGDGQAVVRLTAVLADPVDPDVGWPVDGVLRLYAAVNDRALEIDRELLAYVHLQSVSDEAA